MLNDIWIALGNARELAEEVKIQSIRDDMSEEYQERMNQILFQIDDLQVFITRTEEKYIA